MFSTNALRDPAVRVDSSAPQKFVSVDYQVVRRLLERFEKKAAYLLVSFITEILMPKKIELLTMVENQKEVVNKQTKKKWFLV